MAQLLTKAPYSHGRSFLENESARACADFLFASSN